MKKSEVFDSWATRFGALAILTAAQAVFEAKEAATTGIIFAIIVLSISCIHRIATWALLTFKEMWNLNIFLLFTVGVKDAVILFGMIFSTIAITFYGAPDSADGYIRAFLAAVVNLMESSRFVINVIFLPAFVLAFAFLLVKKLFYKKDG